MRRELAENLLTQVMEWSDEEKARERADLEAFAAFKYDEYQQFAPGRRFLESLALWLRQFDSIEDRQTAYNFVKSRLIYISDAEMSNLVELAFPLYVRPHLMSLAASAAGMPAHRVKRIVETNEYRIFRRRTLVLGLSDGARTDRFRRANPFDISNEQIWHAYDVSGPKADDMLEKLASDLIQIDSDVDDDDKNFRTVVLLDDFTASGKTYIKKSKDGWDGKIPKILAQLEASDGLGTLVADADVRVIVIVYVASQQAIEHIMPLVSEHGFSKGTIEFFVVHDLGAKSRLTTDGDAEIIELQSRYFDKDADDDHGNTGGSSFQYGYSDCRLPVILSHNAPNNSIHLLWAEDLHSVHGLFPRVSRHRRFE